MIWFSHFILAVSTNSGLYSTNLIQSYASTHVEIKSSFVFLAATVTYQTQYSNK